MKKSIILFNILSLFLTSCGNLSTFDDSVRIPSSEERSCAETVKEFYTQEKKTVLSKDEIVKLLKTEVDEIEAADFSNTFSNLDLTEKEAPMVRGILLFSQGNHPLRVSLFNEFQKIRLGDLTLSENKDWQKFLSHQKRVESHAKKFFKKDPKTAEGKTLIFEKLYYSCKSQLKTKPTSADLSQAKKLTYALTVGAASSTAITYTAVGWEQEKNERWFNELYFTLGVSLVSNFLIGKFVLSNPNLSPWKQRMPLTFLSIAINDAAISTGYGFLFGVSDSELEKKLTELKKDPEANARLNELLEIAKEKGLFEKYLKETQALFKDKTTGKVVNPADFEKEITIDDVDLEESRELLMAALAEKEYMDKSGRLVTGSTATDRYSYNRIFNTLNIPANIAVALVMKNQMCMSSNPNIGFAKAVTTYMAASLLFDALYFKGRREVINQ